MAATDVQNEIIYLPEDLVRKSPGFTLDVGSTLTKGIYRSKEDFEAGKPINKEAIKDGLARVHTFRIKRKSGCKPLADIIKEKCDFIRPSDPKEKVKVIVTGMGGHVFKRELEDSLDITIKIALEDECATTGFLLMADLTPMDQFLHPLPEDGLEKAKGHAAVYGGFFKASGTTSIENYSKLTHCETPIPDGSKPFLPCLLITCGSGTSILKLDKDGNRILTDVNMIAGLAFLGFSSYHYGPISFEDLMSKLEATDGRTVDSLLSDVLPSTTAESDVRILPYAKLPDIEDPEKVKKEDVIYSFLRSVVEVQGHLAHVHALAHQVRKIYFMGSFINIPLVRRFLTEHIQGRNLIRPQSQQIDFHFVKRGGFITAIGAFAEGAK